MTASMSSNTIDWPMPRQVFPVSAIDIVVEDTPHPFHLAEQGKAAENWALEIAANPALFDGRVVLQRNVRISNGVVESVAHVVPFSTFMWWRKHRPPGAFHLYGLPVIVSVDGAILAIRMAAHTANAGLVYCAAGSLDDSDVRNGRCDLESNMVREVGEETGLDLLQAQSTSGLFGVHSDGLIAIFKLYRFSQTAEELARRIRAHMTSDPHPEIDDVVIIRDADLSLHSYTMTMRSVLPWFFNDNDNDNDNGNGNGNGKA